jgi:hypothetical protein
MAFTYSFFVVSGLTCKNEYSRAKIKRTMQKLPQFYRVVKPWDADDTRHVKRRRATSDPNAIALAGSTGPIDRSALPVVN